MGRFSNAKCTDWFGIRACFDATRRSLGHGNDNTNLRDYMPQSFYSGVGFTTNYLYNRILLRSKVNIIVINESYNLYPIT